MHLIGNSHDEQIFSNKIVELSVLRRKCCFGNNNLYFFFLVSMIFFFCIRAHSYQANSITFLPISVHQMMISTVLDTTNTFFLSRARKKLSFSNDCYCAASKRFYYIITFSRLLLSSWTVNAKFIFASFMLFVRCLYEHGVRPWEDNR